MEFIGLQEMTYSWGWGNRSGIRTRKLQRQLIVISRNHCAENKNISDMADKQDAELTLWDVGFYETHKNIRQLGKIMITYLALGIMLMLDIV